MSQQNVEQQYGAADVSRPDRDAFLVICDPDIEVVSRHLKLEGAWVFSGAWALSSSHSLSRCTLSGENAGRQTATYSAPSGVE